MNQYLPYGKCKWLNLKKLKKLKEIDKFDVRLIVENSLDGCILEVDFEYPDNYINFIMIIRFQINLKLMIICSQNIVAVSQINLI